MPRRMFSPQIIDSDAFLDMPSAAQALYFHLGMRADDDGFVGNPKKILRMVGGNDDDFKILLAKRFILSFESGIIVIKHWRINNFIRSDRYTETVYIEEKKQLEIKENGSYTELRQPNGNQRLSQVRLGKVRLGNNIFKAPTSEEVKKYCEERKNSIDPEQFINFYESKGWLIGKNKMKNWQAAVRTWEKNNKKAGEVRGEMTLHDGTKAINKFGTWVDARRPEIKINIAYYPELKNL